MKRAFATGAVALILGCGTTLPSEESVILRVADATAAPGAEIDAVLMNNSTERLEVSDACWMRLIDQVSRDPIGPQEECDASHLLLEAGRRHVFTFRAPVTAGVYRLEVPLTAYDPDSESGRLSVRSQAFTVIGPSPRE